MIDLKVEFPPGVGLEQLISVQDRFRAEYPNRRNRMAWTGRFDLGDETVPPSVPERRADGYFFETPSRSRVLQLRLDGFTLHWMRPYDTWEALRDEARARWNDVRAMLAPVRVSRIGVRYINRIDVPVPFNTRDWLLTAPEVSPGLTRPVSNFFMQLQISFPEKGATCVVSQAVEHLPANPDPRAGLIFDIDAARTGEFSADTQEMWDGLAELRAIKNEVFFKSITPRTKGLFA